MTRRKADVMSDGIDQAANAFDQAMGNASVTDNSGKKGGAPIERMFSNIGELDPDSDAAGGDDLPTEEELIEAKKAQRNSNRSRRREANNGDDFDEDDDDLDEDDDFTGLDDFDEDEDDDDLDDEDDDDLDDEDDDDEELASFMKQKFQVMVDGEPTEVTGKEAVNGYIRQKTFHSRMNQVDDLSKAVNQQAAVVVEDRKKYLSLLEDAEQIISSIVPQEPNWDDLYSKDPASARAMEKQYREILQRVADIKEAREKATKEDADAEARAQKAFAQSEFPKFAQNARWKTRKEQRRDLKSMRRTALNTGFPEAEVASVYDSRMLTILLKASKYDRMMAARPKAVRRGEKTTRKGAGRNRNRTAPKRIANAQDKLKSSGSIDDAANVMAELLNRK